MIEPMIAVKQKESGTSVADASAADVLARIDALLDELYALRTIVQRWQDAPNENSSAISHMLKEPAPTASQTLEAEETASGGHSSTPLTDELFGAAGKGTWDEVYSNAEIVHMQFGEE